MKKPNSMVQFITSCATVFDFGCDEIEILECIAHIRKQQLTKKLCVLKKWVILDVVIDNKPGVHFHESRCFSNVLCTGHVLFDFSARFPAGHRVLTSPLLELDYPCFFVTAQTVYLLVGNGFREQIDASVIQLIK